MNCPQCHASLTLIKYEGVPIHTCNSCGGEFIGGEELAQIVRTQEASFDHKQQAALLTHKPDFGHTQSQPKGTLDCPSCLDPMQVINYAGDSGVFIDRCNVCGSIWLDHKELEHIQIVMERWAQDADEQMAAIAGQLQAARSAAAEQTNAEFRHSRFSFVNAVITRLLNAA